MENGEIRQITSAVEDAVTYPILTKEINGYGSRDLDSSRSGFGGNSVGLMARETIRSVLGWRYRANDHKGFLAAVTKSFQLTEVEGHVEWNYQSQPFAIQDLGEVTGAQASIYARSRVALEQSLPLLDKLEALRADADDEDTEAMRSVVRTEFNELVQELGVVGGPRVQRVDSFFQLLLGRDATDHYGEPEDVEGQLGELRDRLGLQRERVNTIEEEQMFTNFLILVDYLNSLHQTWEAQRDSFVRDSTEPFLGTELILLSRILDVLAESVQEAYAALDSVNVGPAERQATELTLRLDDEDRPITISELFSWVDSFATQEGPALIRNSGKDGVVALRFTLTRLLSLITQAHEISRQPSGNPTRGIHTARSQRAFQEIQTHLTAAAGRANKPDRSVIRFQEQIDPDLDKAALGPVPPAPLAAPVVFGIAPQETTMTVGTQTIAVTIFGANFHNGAGIRIGTATDGITANNTTVESAGEITTDLTINPTAAAGGYDVTVTNPGGKSGVKKNGFKLSAPLPAPPVPPQPPTIAGINPGNGTRDSLVPVTVTGTNFSEGTTLKVNGLRVEEIIVLDDKTITANLAIPRHAQLGVRDVVVISNGKEAEKANAFEVRSLPIPAAAIRAPDFINLAVARDTKTRVLMTGPYWKTVKNLELVNVSAKGNPTRLAATVKPGAKQSTWILPKIAVTSPQSFHVIATHNDGTQTSFLNALHVP